jgi:ribulose-phosphate 3-epimerase
VSVRIAPSVLSADLGRLREQVERAVEGGAEWIHVDVMDGHFVPNLTFGAPIISALRRITDRPIDVHLMVYHPEHYITEFAEAGASVFTFHPEAAVHVQRHLAAVRERGMLAGLALNPSTPVAHMEEVVEDLDLVLIMSVNPGYGGQSYLPAATEKIRRVRALLDRAGSRATLEVDGGITTEAWSAGADTFVAGTAVFGVPDPAQAVRELQRRCAVLA